VDSFLKARNEKVDSSEIIDLKTSKAEQMRTHGEFTSYVNPNDEMLYVLEHGASGPKVKRHPTKSNIEQADKNDIKLTFVDGVFTTDVHFIMVK